MTTAPQIRAATPQDVPGIAEVCTRATRQAYASLVTADYLERVVAHWYAHERLLAEIAASPRWFGFTVAVVDDAVAGVAGTGRADEPATCELFTLYVDPRRQRRGVGRALVTDAIRQAREAGATRLQAAAMPGNDDALAFYGSCGFTFAGERPIYAPHGQEGGPEVARVYVRHL